MDSLNNFENSGESPQKRSRSGDTSGLSGESQSKKTTVISPELLKKLGKLFGDTKFLEIFQELYFPASTLEECAQYISDSTNGHPQNFMNSIKNHIIKYQKTNPEAKKYCDVFEMLLNTYIQYNIGDEYTISFNGRPSDVKILSSRVENGKPIFFSELFQIESVNNGSSVELVGQFRIDSRLVRNHDGTFGIIHDSTDSDENWSELIGNGGSYGFAFIMYCPSDQCWYVIKSFYDKKYLVREYKILSIVSGIHQCIQKVVGCQTDRPGDSIMAHITVSEYQGDKTLYELLRDNQLSLQELIKMFLQLAEALKELHKIGYIHGDIKPENIIFHPDGYLVLIDFGISEKIGEPRKDLSLYYTWWFRDPRFLMNLIFKMLNQFKKFEFSPVELSAEKDWWAFFITMMNTFFNKRADFRGWTSSGESEGCKQFEKSSVAMQLINELGTYLNGQNMDFVRQIYQALLDENESKFDEIFKKFGLNIPTRFVYPRYISLFKKWRTEHPVIQQVGMVWNSKRFSCEDPAVDIEEIMMKLNELFIKILRDGADLSILGLLSMDHVNGYFVKLNEIISKISKIEKSIYF